MPDVPAEGEAIAGGGGDGCGGGIKHLPQLEHPDQPHLLAQSLVFPAQKSSQPGVGAGEDGEGKAVGEGVGEGEKIGVVEPDPLMQGQQWKIPAGSRSCLICWSLAALAPQASCTQFSSFPMWL